MNRVVVIIVLILFVGSGVYLGYYFYEKSKKPETEHKILRPERRTIVKKTIATGSIVPRKEIELKSIVSGVVHEIYVEPGENVSEGQLIAKIRIIPNNISLNNAEARLAQARINFKNTERELNRQQELYDQNVITNFDFNKYKLDFEIKQQEVEAAENNLQLVKEGAVKNTKTATNLVRSTVEGLVLDVPVEEGDFVTETNNFNPGTTIAFVANMREMIFEGKVDESEVGKIKEGMKLAIQVAALEDQKFPAKLEYISPKGEVEEGAVKFEVKAAVELIDSVFLRAGYSANADIVLDKREDVISINERELLFEQDTTYVELVKGEDDFEKVIVKTGISDGVFIEVINGLTLDSKIKKQIPQFKKDK